MLEKLAVTPLPNPEALKVTGDASPLTEPTEIAMATEEPWLRVG